MLELILYMISLTAYLLKFSFNNEPPTPEESKKMLYSKDGSPLFSKSRPSTTCSKAFGNIKTN
ncbi:hypothetical protein ES708_22099 [subsurface metagenome]